jgi:hypothetical protein
MKHGLKIRLLIFFVLIAAANLSAQNEIDSIRLSGFVSSFNAFGQTFPQEKIYLHFDNSGYFLGETIWFKAYLTSADDPKNQHPSRILYVELLSPVGNVVDSRKLLVTNGVCNGSFKLKPPLASGFYEVRAYTRYMLDFGEEQIFSRVFPVLNPDNIEDFSSQKNGSVDKKSPFYAKLRKKTPAQKHNPKVSFFPEGGALVNGLPTRVAFKLLDANGHSLNAEGILVESDSEHAQKISSTHNGMGEFHIVPNRKKTARLEFEIEGKKYKFDLPKAEASGFNMNIINQTDTTIAVRIQKSPDLPASLLGLTVTSSGASHFFSVLNLTDVPVDLSVATDSLPAGVNRLTLFGLDGKIIADRLFFVDRPNVAKIRIESKGGACEPFENTEMTIATFNAKGQLIAANLSVSVRDAGTVPENETTGNIMTNLLLSSELRGYIENPEWYFNPVNPNRQKALDLLMLVQGWRRYSWPLYAGLEPFSRKHYAENEILIRGALLKGKKLKPIANAPMLIDLFSADRKKIQHKLQTDSAGCFSLPAGMFAGKRFINFIYDTLVINEPVKITLDRQFSPPAKTFLQEEICQNMLNFPVQFVPDSGANDRLLDRLQLLDTITVASRQDRRRTDFDVEREVNCILDLGLDLPYSNVNTFLRYRDPDFGKGKPKSELAKTGYRDTDGALFYYSRRGGAADIESADDIADLLYNKNIGEIEKIEIHFDDELMRSLQQTPETFAGILLFPFDLPLKTAAGARFTRYEGVALPDVEFYSPDYSLISPVKGDIDDRRTIFWNPTLQTDSTGLATVEFYRNSSSRPVIVSVEGLTSDGQPVAKKIMIGKTSHTDEVDQNVAYLPLSDRLQLNNPALRDYDDEMRKIIVDLYAQLFILPQEKIYLHTDRQCYMPSEKIWFRAYLLHASNNRPINNSRYIYVELVSAHDSVVIRQQIRPDSLLAFHGALSLSDTIDPGRYTLRAYTRYMENFGAECFFTKPVEIVGKKEYEDVYKVRELTQSDSEAPDSADVQTADSPFEVVFFPEGGNLVADNYNRIAFKALTKDGRPADISGTVFNRNDSVLTRFGTVHEGMGVFSFFADHDETAYAVCTDGHDTIRLDLPSLVFTPSLCVNQKSGSIEITFLAPHPKNHQSQDTIPVDTIQNVDPQTSVPAFLPAESINLKPANFEMYLLVHHQGVPAYFERTDENARLNLSKDIFPTGVNHIMLLDQRFRVISHRAVFVNKHDWIEVVAETDKHHYEIRDKVGMTLTVPPSENNIDNLIMSVAVTDDSAIKPDTASSLLSHILLTSELRGTVRDPMQYFSADSATAVCADLLMMTHGWRRYFVDDAIAGAIVRPEIMPETSQSISGTLHGGWFTMSNVHEKIRMSAIGHDYYDLAETDDYGRWRFSMFEFPDSTAYFFRINHPRGKVKMKIMPDMAVYPSAIGTTAVNLSEEASAASPQFLETAVRTAEQKQREREIALQEVLISDRAKAAMPRRLDNHIAMDPDYSVNPEFFEQFPPVSFSQLVSQIPGFEQFLGDEAYIRGKRARFIINNAGPQMTFLDAMTSLNVNDIGQVDVFVDIAKTLYWSSESRIFVAITTRPPLAAADAQSEAPGQTTFIPLGYQLPVEFYAPRYDNPKQQNAALHDFRPTLFWMPAVCVGNDRQVKIEFYTSDSEGASTVTVAGVTADGRLLYTRLPAIIKTD